VRVRPEALESLRLDRETVLTRQFPLLEAQQPGDELGLASERPDVATLGAAPGPNETT
jgi:hypothetical protein